MIQFQHFIKAIHEAVSAAVDGIKINTPALLDQYFEPQKEPNKPITWKPKTVALDYPSFNEVGEIVSAKVDVPLITLTPFSDTQIEKATFTAEFRLSIENDELVIDFPDSKRKKEHSTLGKLEITFAPHETTEGLQQIINGYEDLLKRQIL